MPAVGAIHGINSGSSISAVQPRLLTCAAPREGKCRRPWPPDALVAAIRTLVLDKSEGGRRAQAGIAPRQPFTRGLERKPKPEYEMVEIVPGI